ncbi:MAG: hypothetical protein ABFS32_19905, partial [Bacteroidota bacterium]
MTRTERKGYFKLIPAVAALLVFLSLNSRATQLQGWVDMHTHPMAHLAYGGKLLHGAPDLDTEMAAIPVVENSLFGNVFSCERYRNARDRTEASYDDRVIHGNWDAFKNLCGDPIRYEFIRGMEEALGARSSHIEDESLGYPV